jgi:hypothetical protein
MKPGGLTFWLLLAALIFFIAVASNRAQQPEVGRATDFSSDMYFEPPNEQQVKMRLSGTEALPLPGGLLDVRELKVEVFSTNGTPQLLAQAPQCDYAPLDGVASSAGRLELRSGDGKFRVEGDGFLFLWRKSQSSLVISNHVHTVIETGLLNP